MCYAGNCNPLCDNCRPKYKTCPQCGTETALSSVNCYVCSYEYCDNDFQDAIQDWSRKHPGKRIELNKPFG